MGWALLLGQLGRVVWVCAVHAVQVSASCQLVSPHFASSEDFPCSRRSKYLSPCLGKASAGQLKGCPWGEVMVTVCHCQDSELDAMHKTNSPATYEVYAMQNSPPVQGDDAYFQPLPFDGTKLISGVTAMENPHSKDKYFNDIKDSHYLMVPKGKSHLGDINSVDALAKCVEIP